MKILMKLFGFAMVVGGMALVFKFWDQVVLLFQGVGGMLLAVVGLIVLFLAQEL